MNRVKMQQEPVLCLQLLERRATLLVRLAGAVRAGVESLANLDPEKIYEAVREQELLCQEIRALDLDLRSRLNNLRDTTFEQQLTPEFVRQVAELGLQSKEIEEQVSHWNAIQAGLLRRSRRYVNAVIHVFASYSDLYDGTTVLNPVQFTVRGGA